TSSDYNAALTEVTALSKITRKISMGKVKNNQILEMIIAQSLLEKPRQRSQCAISWSVLTVGILHQQLQTTQAARKLHSREKHPSTDSIIASDCPSIHFQATAVAKQASISPPSSQHLLTQGCNEKPVGMLFCAILGYFGAISIQ
uniref:Uncharacterized protein n=1 Tax=Neolamprologus brichardi TaxID=32507 RepID=A0A3Q4GBM4_NEOBR